MIDEYITWMKEKEIDITEAECLSRIRVDYVPGVIARVTTGEYEYTYDLGDEIVEPLQLEIDVFY